MLNLLHLLISLFLSAGFAFANAPIDIQMAIVKPIVYALATDDRRELKLAIEKAEGQFSANKDTFEKSADILNGLQDITIALEPGNAGRRKTRDNIELSSGRMLYVAANRELSEEEMALLNTHEVTDIFNKTDCIEMSMEDTYIIFWWEMPRPTAPALISIGGGVIYVTNQDQLPSWYKIRSSLAENWVSFLYSSVE